MQSINSKFSIKTCKNITEKTLTNNEKQKNKKTKTKYFQN